MQENTEEPADPMADLTDAEAMGVLVAQTITGWEEKALQLTGLLAEARGLLGDLVKAFPVTSFAGVNEPLERARVYLAGPVEPVQSKETRTGEPDAPTPQV